MIKPRILIIGSNGMLGQRLQNFYSNSDKYELMTASAEEKSFFPEYNYKKIDITNKVEVKKIFLEFFPDTVINTAAYTNVDGCEKNREIAWDVNVKGVEYLVKYSTAIHSHLIQVSTDYVFDGLDGPYSEKDKVNPISYYGRSKLAAENVLTASSIDWTIVRTNVLYGPAKFGRADFVKWVVTSLREGKNIKIVDDQINNPTYIDNLAWALFAFGKKKKLGLFNIGGKDVLNRYQFTLRIAEYFNLDKSLITRIKTSELNQPAPRPLNSGLINLKSETEIGYKPFTIEETFNLIAEELSL